jgi:predicted flap endonuclease-1-like 5' DNA nuclease
MNERGIAMNSQSEELPSGTKTQNAIVKKPKKYLKSRKGKGFSLNEIKSASIPLDDAKKLPISIDTRRKSIHDENVRILSALYREVVSKRSEEKIKFDRSNKEAFKELKQLKGIRSNEAKLLIEAGVKSLITLTEEEPASLADDTKILVEKMEKWITQAKSLIVRKKVSDNIEELLQIKGMNKTYARKLVNFGILTIEDLSQENAEILAKDLKLSEKILSIWIEDAMRLTGKPIPVKKKPPKKKEEKPPKPKVEKKKVKKPPAPKVEKKKAEKPPTPKIEKKKAPTLKDIPGIGKGDIKELKELGITAIQDLVKEEAVEIASITGLNQATIQEWIDNAKGLLGLPTQEVKEVQEEATVTEETTGDPLKELLKLKGVGKKTAEKLIEAGFTTCSELADCDPKELSQKAKISEKTAVKITESAKELVE